MLDCEEADPDVDIFGLGKIEDFTWKGCWTWRPAPSAAAASRSARVWTTGKPLSPKQVIPDLRGHAFAKTPYILAASDEAPEKLPANILAEADRPLVGTEATRGVIDPDVRRGNPWGMADRRADWISELDIEVPVLDGRIPDDVEYLYWVDCVGVLEDRAKKATKAIAELLHAAEVKFAVLAPMEACAGGSLRWWPK